jgi:hypothetical protein
VTEVHRAVPRVFSEVRDGYDWYAKMKVNYLLPREMPARSIGPVRRRPLAGGPGCANGRFGVWLHARSGSMIWRPCRSRDERI